MPWKNGKGLTEEIMAFPVGSTMETFDWRLSIAHVGQDGPFSVFPGVDRSIAMLEGEGLRLDLPDGTGHELSLDGDPFTFPGEWVISSTNLGGPTMDLNIMTRRGHYQHQMRRYRSVDPLTVNAEVQTLLLFKSAASLSTSEGTTPVEPFSCVMLDSSEGCTITSQDMLHVLIIELDAAE